MKPWNASENRPRPLMASLLRALARRVHEWLGRLLEEGENSDVYPSAQHSANMGVTHNDAGTASRGKKEAEVPPWNLLQKPGPPEHWLRLVREGAPELLRSVEEGGVPWLSARRVSTDKDNPQPETPSATESLSCPEALTRPTNEPIKGTGSLSETATLATVSLLQALRRLGLTSIIQKKKERVAEKGRSQLPFEPARLATRFCPRPAAGRPPQHVAPTQQAATEFESEGLPKKHTVAPLAPPPSWGERVLQRAREVFPNAFMNRPTSKERAEPKNENTQFTAREKPFRHLESDVNRDSSLWTSRSLGFEWPSGDGCPNPGVSSSQQGSKIWLGRRSNPSMWMPLPTNATSMRMQTQESSSIGTAKGGVRNVELLTSQRVDLDSLDSTRWPESGQIDSWPELPEDSRVNDTIWRESLRVSDHLRALDLEQRGGR